jgi:hypothetical protein
MLNKEQINQILQEAASDPRVQTVLLAGILCPWETNGRERFGCQMFNQRWI